MDRIKKLRINSIYNYKTSSFLAFKKYILQ